MFRTGRSGHAQRGRFLSTRQPSADLFSEANRAAPEVSEASGLPRPASAWVIADPFTRA
ncbi:hypothetical protein SMICM304S_04437 [Streptomyces microflavus]